MRDLRLTFIALLPASRYKNFLLRAIGHDVAKSARFGPCLVMGLDHIELEPDASIGPFNVLRDLSTLHLGHASVIGQWNWISASLPLRSAGGSGQFELGRHSALTSRHYVDASGGVTIGEFTTFAGVRSTIITHGINWKSSTQVTKPITIGSYCIISSNAAITPGTVIGNGTIIGMGATVAGILPQNSALYISERAKLVKVNVSGKYFERSSGFVHPAA